MPSKTFKKFRNIAQLILLDKQCFVTWQNAQTLRDKQTSNVWQTMFDRLVRALETRLLDILEIPSSKIEV